MRWGAAAVVVLWGCTVIPPAGMPTAPRADSVADGPWADLESSREFLIRQRLHYKAAGRSGHFEIVIQVVCATLTVVGLSPFGTRIFSIRQKGDIIKTNPAPETDWPFPPEHLLLDVHRALLYPLAGPPPGNGFHVYKYRRTLVRELWRDGRLMERIVPASSRPEDGDVRLFYEGGVAPGKIPTTVRLRNDRDGYRLTLVLLEERELKCLEPTPPHGRPLCQ